jgi:tetratricopeptide (TPR) repeat protein
VYVDIIDSFETLTEFRANWDAVYDADPEAQFFLSWTWIYNWFDKLDVQWIILAAKPHADSANYVAFFPLQFRTELNGEGIFFNELRMGGGYSTTYEGFICTPESQESAVPAFGRRLQELNWTNFHFENIRMSDERLRLFLSSFPDSVFTCAKAVRFDEGDGINSDIHPYVKLPGDFETFLQNNLGPHTRRNARLSMRLIDNPGEYRITHATEESIERDVATLLRLWESRWSPKKSERELRISLNNFRKMFIRSFKADSLLLLMLWRGETPIGAVANYIDRKNRTLLSSTCSRDPAVKNPSPVFTLHLYGIRWAIQNGFTTYDFLRGNEAYKYQYACEERIIECMRISTKTGRNLGDTLDPRCLPVVLSRAKNLRRNEKLAEAERACRQILDVDPQHPGGLELLAQMQAAANLAKAFELHQQGKLAEAETAYRAAQAAQPRNFNAANLLGVLHLQRNELEAAERQLSAAVAIKPDNAGAHNNLGSAFRGLKRFEEALASFDRAIALKPDHAEAHNNRGNALLDLRRLDDALASYDQAIALKPDYVAAQKNREVVLRQLGR